MYAHFWMYYNLISKRLWLFCLFTLALDHHPHCSKFAIRRVFQAFPFKVWTVWTRKTRNPAAVEPPSRIVLFGAVDVRFFVVIEVGSWESHSVVVPIGLHCPVRQWIGGISTEPRDLNGVLLVFRIKRKASIIGLVPGIVRVHLLNETHRWLNTEIKTITLILICLRRTQPFYIHPIHRFSDPPNQIRN